MMTGLLLLISLQTGSPTEESLARASALILAEVVRLEEKDQRPACGNHLLQAQLRPIRGSGEAPAGIIIVKAFGGRRAPGGPEPKDGPLLPDSLKPGAQYWFLFSSSHDRARYPQGVIAWWPEVAVPETLAVIRKAVEDDRYSWNPQFEPASGLTYGHRAEKNSWRIQVKKGARILWEKTLEGRRSERHAAWSLFPAEALPRSGEIGPSSPAWLLRAETGTELSAGNDYDLPAGNYYVATTFEALTERTALIEVSNLSGPLVERVYRAFDLTTAKRRIERRWDFLETGGIAAGAATESWLRQIERRYSAESDAPLSEEISRFAQSDWVKVR